MKKCAVFLLMLAFFTAACNLPASTPTNAETPTENPPPTAPPTATTSPARIEGLLFHDLCGIAGGEAGTPIYAGAGCVTPAGELPRANGVLDPGEPPIPGVEVTLKSGACPGASLAAAALTQTDGSFTFPDLPAGSYCVSIDPLSPTNASILIPGGFTLPAGVLKEVEVILSAGELVGGILFGWDYDGLPSVTPPLGQIGGMVFHDECGIRENPGSGTPPTYVGNCIVNPDSSWYANGILDGGEKGLAGVRVKLSSGACPPVSWIKTYDTPTNGYFLFKDLPAGAYCVHINSLEEPSLSALIPGGWTLPFIENSIAAIPVTIGWGESALYVNFGWDFQFLP